MRPRAPPDRRLRAALARTALGEELPEGRFVALAVEGSGCGMTPSTLARLFEPFY